MARRFSGEQLKALREKRKMLQQDLATKLNIDRTAVTKWENDITNPKADMLPKLAEILKCKIDNFYKEV